MDNGDVASFQDNSAHGEDAFVIRELGSSSTLDVVLDGVTHCEGGYASSFTAQVLKEAAIGDLGDLIGALEQANQILFREGRGRSLLTTVSAVLKLGDEAHILSAGDSPVYSMRGNRILTLTPVPEAQQLPALTGGAVGLTESFTYSCSALELVPGDKLLLTTDGLVHNLLEEELGTILRRAATPQGAVSEVRALLAEKRRRREGRTDTFGTFKEDDQTAILRFFP